MTLPALPVPRAAALALTPLLVGCSAQSAPDHDRAPAPSWTPVSVPGGLGADQEMASVVGVLGRSAELPALMVGAGPVAIIDRYGNANNNSVDYPAKIVAQNGGITATVQGGVNPVAWSPLTSGDNPLETGATTPTASTDTTVPTVSATQLRLTMSEAVRGSFGNGSGTGPIAAGTFEHDADGTAGGDTPATGAPVSSDGLTVTLTFPATTVSTTGDAADRIVYAPVGAASAAAGDVVDTDDNRLAASITEAASGRERPQAVVVPVTGVSSAPLVVLSADGPR